MKEIEFSRWLFELPAKQHSQFSPSGSKFLPCLGLPLKSHRENSIFSIFFESPHQVDMKNVVKCQKHFFGYFNALKTYCLWFLHDSSVVFCNEEKCVQCHRQFPQPLMSSTRICICVCESCPRRSDACTKCQSSPCTGTYSRVHISSVKVFSKILKKPSIVKKQIISFISAI